MLHVVSLLLVGCTPPDEPTGSGPTTPVDTDPTTDSDTTIDTDTTPTGTTGDTATTSTGTTGDTGPEVVLDCAALPAAPLARQILGAPRAYHGLAFDTIGNLIGVTNGAPLVSYDYYGGSVPYSPNISGAQQADMHPNGNLYVAGGAGIYEVQPNGVQTAVGTVGGAYGLKVGPDEKIYVGDNSRMYRIDLVTGDQTVYLPNDVVASRIMDWSPDGTRMYVAQQFGGVYAVDLDANYDPIGQPYPYANVVGSWLDGMQVDVCGNVYVTIYSSSEIVKITTDGVIHPYVDSIGDFHMHGMMWGSGIGGWLEDAFYGPLPYNSDMVVEYQVGSYHRTWQGTVLNGP